MLKFKTGIRQIISLEVSTFTSR